MVSDLYQFAISRDYFTLPAVGNCQSLTKTNSRYILRKYLVNNQITFLNPTILSINKHKERAENTWKQNNNMVSDFLNDCTIFLRTGQSQYINCQIKTIIITQYIQRSVIKINEPKYKHIPLDHLIILFNNRVSKIKSLNKEIISQLTRETQSCDKEKVDE